MKILSACGASFILLALAACQSPIPESAETTARAETPDPCLDPTINYPADLCVDMIEPEIGPAPEMTAVPLETCPDEGERLPISNVCQGRAVNYMNTEDLMMDAPAGCVWEVQEVDLLLDEALLFRSLTCGETETRLALSGGAKSASLSYLSSALGHENGADAVRVFGGGDADPVSYIRSVIDDRSDAGCTVMAANTEGWPSEALVIAVPAPDGETAKEADCGPFGHLSDAASYWRIVGDYAMYFDLGQDLPAIDPGSLTLVLKP